jgi:hypothetical protein
MSKHWKKPESSAGAGHAIDLAADRHHDERVAPPEIRMTLNRRIAKLIERIARASRLASM